MLLTAVVTTFGTGIVVFVGHRLSVRRDSDEEKERGTRYLAIRVTCILDPFILERCEVVGDNSSPDSNDLGLPVVKAAELALPRDVAWQSVDHNLAYRILSLPNDIEAA